MGLSALAQEARSELRTGMIIRMVDISLDGLTLHLSDRDFRYIFGSTEILYESYLNDITGISGSAEIFGTGNGNSSISMNLKNDAYGSYPHLVLMNWDKPFTLAPFTVYELRLIADDEVFASDVRQVIFKGNIEQITGPVTVESFTLTGSSRLHSGASQFGQEKFRKADFPYADPQTIGKVRNVLVGDLEYVPCQPVLSSAIDLLAIGIDKESESITVSGAAQIPWPEVPFTVQVDDEKMVCSGVSGRVLTISARGSGDTKTMSHSAGAPLFAVIPQYVYELAEHSVKHIGDLFIDGVLIDPSLYTSYTGQEGGRLSGFGSSAVIAFPIKPTKGRKITAEINEGQHTHGLGSGLTKEKHGVSHELLFGSCGNPENAYDGDLNSYSQINTDPILASKLKINFDSTGSGDLSQVDVYLYWHGWESKPNNWVQVKFGNAFVVTKTATFGSAGNPIHHHFTLTNTSKFSWTSSLTIETSQDFGCRVYDAYVVFTYGGIIPHDDTVDVSTIMGGQTVSDLVIGGEITAHVQGMYDAAGAITGTVNALIERPDHVFSALLEGYGHDLADLGSSFAAAGIFYAAKGYKLAFILSDIGSDAAGILDELAKQCRSVFTDWAGKFELCPIPDSVARGDEDFTLSAGDDVLGNPSFSFGGRSEIKNHVNGFYRRDYRESSGSKESREIIGVSPDARAKGYMDMMEAASGTDDRPEDLLLSAVRTSAMAQDVTDFWQNWKKIPRITADCTAMWRAILAGPGQKIMMSDPLFGANIYLVTNFQPHNPELGQVGLQLVWLGALDGGFGSGRFGDQNYGQ